MIVQGVEPSIRARCDVTSFTAAYGSNCLLGAAEFAVCYDRCKWEMRINLLIETIGLAGVVAFIIVSSIRLARVAQLSLRQLTSSLFCAGLQSFLAWDASRVASSMRIWSYHPLRARWHSDLMLFNRYADVSRRVGSAEETPERDTFEAKRMQELVNRAQRRRNGESVTTQEEGEDAEQTGAGTTFGSGAVGSGPTTRRRKGPLTQLFHERHEEATSDDVKMTQPTASRSE